MNEIDYSQFAPTTEIGFAPDHCHDHDHDQDDHGHCPVVPEASMLFPMVSFLLVVLLTRWLRDQHNRKVKRLKRFINDAL